MPGILTPILHSAACIKKHPQNPILTNQDVPYPSDLVFNAGVAKINGTYVMLFRNDYDHIVNAQFGGTNIGLATSKDGIVWEVAKKPFFSQEDIGDPEISRFYDPRITVIDGRAYICFAVDTHHGIRGGIGVTDDFEHLEILHMTAPDNRNMVLFPEKIGGLYVRLERPFPVYGRPKDPKFDIWLSKSPDLRYFGDTSLLLAVENVPYANDKLGPAAPPIKTKKGWLTTFHTVDIEEDRGKNGWEERPWKKRYCAGLMLLDLEDPTKIVGMAKSPLIAPEESYETDGGFRNSVIFPGGMILEDTGEVKIYYGASDTFECLATADVDDLIALCLN